MYVCLREISRGKSLSLRPSYLSRTRQMRKDGHGASYVYRISSRVRAARTHRERTDRTTKERATERTRTMAAEPKGALTSCQANIFDGLMKTAVRTRASGGMLLVRKSKTRR